MQALRDAIRIVYPARHWFSQTDDDTENDAPGAYRLTGLDYLFRALAVLAFIEIGALVLDIAVHPNAPGIVGQGQWLRIFMGLTTGPFTILLSALLLWRVPSNCVGRFLLLLGILQVSSQFSFDWGAPMLVGFALALLILFAGGIAAPSIGYLMLNFPTGQIYPPQWLRVVLGLAILKFVGVVLELMASPRDIKIFTLPVNPLFVPALAPIQPWIAATIGVAGLLLPVILIMGMLSLVLRYRASAARVQQQIKWVIWAFGAILPVVLVAFGTIFNRSLSSVPISLITALGVSAQLLLVLSISIAILRYRLFDIDLIIRRTLTYALVSAVLLLVFFGTIVVLQQFFAAVTGTRQNELVTVLSTLGIAALFVPLRNRIQDAVDRRFNRSKYDAQQVLMKFAATVRDETDLEMLSTELISLVNETMQPRSVSLWLKKPEDRR